MCEANFKVLDNKISATVDDMLFIRASHVFYDQKTNELQVLIGDQILQFGHLPKDISCLFCDAANMELEAIHPNGQKVILHATTTAIH